MEFDYDLFVIGAGSGGVRLARMSASYGARVGIAEEEQIGGTCVLRGCIPKKLLVYASHYPHELEDAKGFGWTFGAGTLDWPALIAAKDREINRLSDIYINLLRQSGVEMHAGRATLVDAHTVAIGDRTIRARHIAIATGSRPSLPPRPGIEHAITSREALSLAKLPERIAVVGGGYIAVEFAGIFNGFGSHVDLFYRGEKILRGFDDDVRHFLTDEMTKQGVAIHARAVVESIVRADDGTLFVGVGEAQHGPYDAVLYATGRVPNVEGLGLERAGVLLDARGAIAVDAYSATSVASIHAIGDVTSRPQLTPVATRDGALLAATLFGGRRAATDHEWVPSAVFSQPEVATVGLTEAHARAVYGELDIYRTSFKALRHTLSGRDERTLMKLVVARDSQRVVGAHMVGRDAGEIIQGIAIAIRAGATKAQFDDTIGIHPTAAEEFVTLRQKVAD
ncbi:glutathione-disulfide reductase [Burkholderia ambifaria AMMD]|uniref:Glutathione reductase n=1 Tax=Burkholderia ambifaria (strain ATCC BAA-244 / DSM 16087 / CCUG 44356 / LMG 19182 / AMMD) TaxID=339670 RepID=Q0BB67_BURCM|nr:glutathione-disulfide reductase [Burkholderia ambifaria]ABI88606.1 NADPH-glutathione reductase [Burkholderia ambifaria AMMD]AJY22330.1 glutathione-disulfide reductase [Burkholderia ambifaria AMMD]MBR7931278.1 glutathione-disulfide reductase [Burkholderia ambifaria]PEH67239.1 glutathione-disulfide reductase [Burkholderia ambifaria]QQC04221.1 glutathione-disulfide reductase [Burkholderia ambifaria]